MRSIRDDRRFYERDRIAICCSCGNCIFIAVICYLKLIFRSAHRNVNDGFDFLLKFKNRGNELRALVIFWVAVLVCSLCIWYFTVHLQPYGKGFKSVIFMIVKTVNAVSWA